MLSLLILTIVMGGVFWQLDRAQQRSYTEQAKLDDFQEVRDFVDQFFRDINQIGDPNSRIFDLSGGTWSPALASPVINDNRFAIGLVKIDANAIQFESSVNGISTVQSIQYMINGSGACTLCLQRSQADKVTASPLTGQNTNWGTEVNDVVTAVFKYFDTTVTKLPACPWTSAPLPVLTPSPPSRPSRLTCEWMILRKSTGRQAWRSRGFEGEVVCEQLFDGFQRTGHELQLGG